ncbi:MAG: flagellin [Desulfovibrio sp.]|nr:flagellin [Desulfovibrio sp.]
MGQDPNNTSAINFSLQDMNGDVDLGAIDPNIVGLEVNTGTGKYTLTTKAVVITDDTTDYTASYNEDTQTVTVTLKNGGAATLKLDNALSVGDTVNFDIDLAGEIQTVPVEHHGVDPDQKLILHFGPMNDSAEDYYHINYANCTLEGLGLAGVDIQTQENAQNALVQINDAIVNKDKARAYFGAMQNRIENTITNLTVQAENLQAAESRISDADIANEMMTFVRNQILTQSAVAMLAQANSMPQMVMALIH